MAALDVDVKEGVDRETVDAVKSVGTYKHGWETEVETEFAPKGLNEDIVRLISQKKNEPEWMLEWRLAAYRRWLEQPEPDWAMLEITPIDYQEQYYYAQPASFNEKPKSLDDVDPELLRTYEKLGIPLREQAVLAGVEGAGTAPAEGREGDKRKVAVDAVFDSVSLGTTFQDELAKAGVIFCSISEALQEHPELVRKYLGSVIPNSDNKFATLNAAVFSDGSFVYVPPGVRCPMELSTYFRINAENTGQFERTLIIADKGSYVSYLEGCTAPQRDDNQLHAACVELIALEDAEIKYSTVQNWYPGDENGKGGIYNFVTKRGDCRGARSKISWTQVETGSSITWKYPSCILRGDDSRASSTRSPSPTTPSRRTPAPRWCISAGTPAAGSSPRASRRAGAEHLSRARGHAPPCGQQPQLHAVRLAPDRRGLRRAHRALHQRQEHLLAGRARGDDVEGGRRPALLLHLARHRRGGGRGAHRQRLLQGGSAGAADGVRHGGPGAGEDQPRGLRRLMIVTTTPGVEGRRITGYRGIVVGEAILGANVIRDVFAGITDILGGRSSAYEEELGKARTVALDELETRARALGADAVVGVDLDYEVINSMLMVSASGTAVTLGDQG